MVGSLLLLWTLVVSVSGLSYDFHFDKDSNLYNLLEQNSGGSSESSISRGLASPSSSKANGPWKCAIIGTGSAVPSQVVSNFDLEKVVNTSDKWIQSRTGIANRRVLLPRESLRSLGSLAAMRALEDANVKPEDVDMVIVASSSPDDLFGDATGVAGIIGATNAAAWDLTAACSGFLFAVVTASQFLHSGAYKNIVVVGADALSRWVDWTDRNTCVLFGDGAGAVVMQSVSDESASGLLSFHLKSDSSGRNHLNLLWGCNGDGKNGDCHNGRDESSRVSTSRGATSDQSSFQVDGQYQKVTMNGRDVYKFVVKEIPIAIEQALAASGIEKSQVDVLLLHQANNRILEAIASRLGIPRKKLISNISQYGNTSAASIPLALDEAVRGGQIKEGDIVVSAGFGAGLSYGVAIFKWSRKMRF